MPTYKKTWCIVKVACSDNCADRNCTSCSFKKWVVNSQTAFVGFLDNNHPTWRYYNVFVFDKSKKDRRGPQIGSFTKTRRPHHPWVTV